VEKWNSLMEAKVKMDEPSGDVVEKLSAAIAAGDLVWDGYSMVENFNFKQWVQRGLMVPVEDFTAASKIPNADKVLPAVIEPMKESIRVDGKIYGYPFNVAGEVLQWYWEPVKKAGFEQQPATWDEVYEAAKKIKEGSPEYTPFAPICEPLCGLWTLLWGAKAQPYDSEGLIDIRSKEAIDALKWYRKLVEEELMPAVTKDSFSDWMKGGIAICLGYDVLGNMAQQTFGVDKATTGTNIYPEKGKTNAGSPFNINSNVILNKAKNPQGMADFYLWCFGPDNKEMGKQITEVAAKPGYTYTYDEFIKGNPQHAWQLAGLELIKTSVPFRVDTWWMIQNNMTKPGVEKALDLSQKFEPEAAMEEVYQNVKAEIAKQK